VALLRKILIFSFAAGAAYIFYINLCDIMFHCGCHSMWSGGAAVCNVWMENMAHCPFCSHGNWGSLYPRLAIWTGQAAVVFPSWRLSDRNRLLLSLAVFLVVIGIIGLFFAIYSGYPTFLFFHLS
jgi:hypothetical protein